MPLRAAIYARISSDRDDSRLGVKRQEKDCRDLATKRGWDVVGVFSDNDVSATKRGRKRPEYERLLRAIKNGEVDAVVVYDLDRLHRQPAELEDFVTVCDAAGVKELAVYVGGSVDVATGDGMMVARMKGAVAAEEARKIAQRIRRKQQELAERGLPNGGGKRPFGWEEGGTKIRESEAQRIREVAQQVLEGRSLRSIRDEWQRLGVATVTGAPWRQSSVKATLKSPRNAGLRQHQGAVVGEASWPAIIDRETWDQLQVIFADPSRQRRSPSRAYPLRGVVRCGLCDHELVAVPRKRPIPSDPDRRERYYGCRTDADGCGKVFVTAHHVEAVVDELILSLLDDPRTAAITAGQAAEEQDEIRGLIQANAKDQKRIGKLEDAFAAPDGISLAGLQRNRRPILAEIEKRNARIAALKGTSAIDRIGGNPREVWDSMDADDKRAVLLSLLTKIVVKPKARGGFNVFDPDRIEYEWRYDALSDLARESPGRRIVVPIVKDTGRQAVVEFQAAKNGSGVLHATRTLVDGQWTYGLLAEDPPDLLPPEGECWRGFDDLPGPR